MGCGSSVAEVASRDFIVRTGRLPAPAARQAAADEFLSAKRLRRGCNSGSAAVRRFSSGNHIDDEDMLSDISSTGSVGRSTLDMQSMSGRGSVCMEDLEQQRQNLPGLIDENLFVYDDVVMARNEIQPKAWRPEAPRQSAEVRRCRSVSRRLSTGARKAKSNIFCFADFKVCVDEIEAAMGESSGKQSRHRLSVLTRNSDEDDTPSGARVSLVCSSRPNAFAVLRSRMFAQQELTRVQFSGKISPRDIRNFHTRTSIGHSSRLRCLSLSPNEKTLVSCSNEETSVTLRNLVGDEERGTFSGHRDAVMCTAFSADGKYLATGSKDKCLILWDTAITKMLMVFKHDKVVVCCHFSPDSKRVVAGCQDRVCRVWDILRGSLVVTYSRHCGMIAAVCYSPDGFSICSGSADKTVRVWGAERGGTRLTLSGHVGIVLSCSCSADGEHIFSNDEAFLCMWDARDGRCQMRLSVAEFVRKCGHISRVKRLGWTLCSAAPGAFTNYVVVACANRFVYVIDVRTGEEFISTFCKAPVYALTCGRCSTVSFGDTFGNIYVQELA